MKTMRDKYENDVAFKQLVDYMASFINENKYTPSEMRQAAIMASIIYEEHHVCKISFFDPEIEAALLTLDKKINEQCQTKK